MNYNNQMLINSNDNIRKSVDLHYECTNGIINKENLNELKIILDSYYTLKENSEKYIIENINTMNEINYYFEDLFSGNIGSPLLIYIKLMNNQTDDLKELMSMNIYDKIKLMPLPNLIIHFSKENGYDIKMLFESNENSYSTSLWFHYNLKLELINFWVDEIDPWK